jgi:hypothetical protein
MRKDARIVLTKKFATADFYSCLRSGFANELKIPVTMERIMLKSNAHQKPFTWKP